MSRNNARRYLLKGGKLSHGFSKLWATMAALVPLTGGGRSGRPGRPGSFESGGVGVLGRGRRWLVALLGKARAPALLKQVGALHHLLLQRCGQKDRCLEVGTGFPHTIGQVMARQVASPIAHLIHALKARSHTCVSLRRGSAMH